MTDEEFRAIIKCATPQYRRVLFFLMWTGCRPCELCRLTWLHLRLEECIAVLAASEHKTGRFGKARVIVLDERTIKLLLWIRKQKPPAVETLRRILARGRWVPAAKLNRLMHEAGYSDRMIFRAKKTLGVKHRRLGRGRGSAYRLPVGQLPTGVPDCDAFIFLNQRGTRWDRHSLAHNLARLREEAGVPRAARQYGLRHRFGTNGVKSGVPLLALAQLMGHAQVKTTQYYCHLEDDTQFLQRAAAQVNAYRPTSKGGRA